MFGRALLYHGEGVIHSLLDLLDRITGQTKRDREAAEKARLAREDTWGRD